MTKLIVTALAIGLATALQPAAHAQFGSGIVYDPTQSAHAVVLGTTTAVQQKLMRHADIRTTMNVYGTMVTDEMSTASGKVARLVVNGTGGGTEPSSSH